MLDGDTSEQADFVVVGSALEAPGREAGLGVGVGVGVGVGPAVELRALVEAIGRRDPAG